MVLNKYKDKIPKDAIYIGRGSKWGNPFIMGKDGNRDDVCEKFNIYLKEQIRIGIFRLEDLASLYGKNLVCFCAPERCHGHSLEKAAAWAYNKLKQRKENDLQKQQERV